MSGSTLRVMAAQTIIKAAAMKYMARQPSQSPTKPEMTREARMPVKRPDMTMPTLRLLCSGRENCEAMGTKICGMTEQIPVTSEAAQMM